MVLRSSLSVRPWHEVIKTIELVIYDAAAPMIHSCFVRRAAFVRFAMPRWKAGFV